MRFVNKWSYACAKSLATAMNEDHKKRSIYYYSFQVVIGDTIKVTVLISLAFLLGVLIPMLLITLTFASLRKIAGGYHMDTFAKCLFVSLGLFAVAALVTQYAYFYWDTVYLVALTTITFFTGLYVLIRYAPRDTPNKPITNPKDIKKFKSLSIAYIFVWAIIVIALILFGHKMLVLSLCFGVLLELFAISHIGHKFFDIIKYKFDIRKRLKANI